MVLKSQIDVGRFLAALVAIPLADALLGYALFPVVRWLGGHGQFATSSPDAAVSFGVICGAFAFLVIITAGLPVSSWLSRRGRTSVLHFAAAGAALGNLPFAAYLWVMLGFTISHLVAGTLGEHLSPITELVKGGLRVVLIGSAAGVVSGSMFWLLAGPTPFHRARIG